MQGGCSLQRRGELGAECVCARLRFLMIFRIFYCFRGNLHCRPAVRLSPDSCIPMDFMNSGIRNHRLALISHIPEARCMSFAGFWIPDLLTFIDFMIVRSRVWDLHWYLVFLDRSMASFGFWGPDSMVFMDFMFRASRFEDLHGFIRYWNTHSLIIIDFCS